MTVHDPRFAGWLPGGHAQTIYPALFGRLPGVRFMRRRVETPDGDFIDIDWASPAEGSPRWLLTLFHGLEGSSASHYAQTLTAAATRRGYVVAVPHFRTCSGEENRLPRAYHSGDSDEIDFMLRTTRAAYPELPAVGVGVSLGGNALLKWLGEPREHRLDAAVAISAPVDLAAGGAALGRGFNLVYTRMFLATLKTKALAKLRRYPDLFDGERMRRARTLREFDDLYTAPVHGFRDALDYWQRAASKPYLRAIDVPTLMINAQNDPFLPAAHLPHAGEVSRSVTLEYPLHGGHVGFMTGRFPGELSWLPQRVLRFLDG